MLSSCVSPTTRPPADAAKTLDSYPSSWEVSGKLSIRSTVTSAVTQVSNAPKTLRFSWRQLDEDYVITLYGRLNLGRVVITKEANSITLTRGNKRLASANSAEALLYQQTGWELPVSLLRYWILGQVSPNHDYLFSNQLAGQLNDQPLEAISRANQTPSDEHSISGFTQRGWQLTFPKAALVDGYTLPTKLRGEQSQLTIVAALHNWQILDNH